MGYKNPEMEKLSAVFCGIGQRCNNPNHISYKNYGGRGIKCLFNTFNEFLQELGPKPTKNHTVNRIDNDKHYEPGNIEWTTWTKQNQSKRISKRNKSGFPGVYFNKRDELWYATEGTKKKYLYCGPSFIDALAHKLLAMEARV